MPIETIPSEPHTVAADTFLIPTMALAAQPAPPTPGQGMLDELLAAFAPTTDVAA